MISTLPPVPAAPLVALRFRPTRPYIDGVREFCRSFLDAAYQQRDLAERARSILQEALANAVKFSTEDDLSELELELRAERESFRFSITSRLDPRNLQASQDELNHLTLLDPEAAYIAAFVRSSHDREGFAQRGFARAACEVRVELHLDALADGRLRITAAARRRTPKTTLYR